MTENDKILINFKLEKAYNALDEALIILKDELWNLIVNRLYYSCFYSVLALLFCIELYPKTHKGTHNLFYQHFIMTEKLPSNLSSFFSTLFDARQECDYKEFVKYKKSDVLPMLEITGDFLNIISKYINENYLDKKN